MGFADEMAFVEAPTLDNNNSAVLPASSGDAATVTLTHEKKRAVRIHTSAAAYVLFLKRGQTAPTDVDSSNGWPVPPDQDVEFNVRSNVVSFRIQAAADSAGTFWWYYSL